MKDTRTFRQRIAWLWRRRLAFESYNADQTVRARQLLAQHQIFYQEKWLTRDYRDPIRGIARVDSTRYELYVDKSDLAQAEALIDMGDF